MSETKTKACTKCGESKPLIEFHKQVQSLDGLNYYCKVCVSANAKEYRRNPPPPRPSRQAKDGIKCCNICQQLKPVAEFSKNAKSPDGRGYRCKSCEVAYQKAYHRKSHTPRPSHRAHNGAKLCSACKRSKPVAEFNKTTRSPNGLSYNCKACRIARARRNNLKRNFGLTETDWQQMFTDQKGVCAICSKPETMKLRSKLIPLAVDHDHKTGDVRGLLCHRCNRALGGFHDNANLLHKAGDYLEGAACTKS